MLSQLCATHAQRGLLRSHHQHERCCGRRAARLGVNALHPPSDPQPARSTRPVTARLGSNPGTVALNTGLDHKLTPAYNHVCQGRWREPHTACSGDPTREAVCAHLHGRHVGSGKHHLSIVWGIYPATLCCLTLLSEFFRLNSSHFHKNNHKKGNGPYRLSLASTPCAE